MLCSITFLRKSCRFLRKCVKMRYSHRGHRWQYVIQIAVPWHHSRERTCLIITFIRAKPGLLFVRRQTFLNVRVVSSRPVLRTHWGSIVCFQIKFLDTFRHSMKAPGGKIRQNKAWTFIDYLVLTWHETPECGLRLNGLVTLHWSVEISFIDWWVINTTRKRCKRYIFYYTY